VTWTVVLDADATNWLADQPTAHAELSAAVSTGHLRPIMPGSVKRQTERGTDAETHVRRGRIVALTDPVRVPFAIGSSAIGADYFGSDYDAARHDLIRRAGTLAERARSLWRNPRNVTSDSVDALLVAAALDNAATLVTRDVRLTRRAKAAKCDAIGPEELLRLLR
jgi:hypothetical protein